MDIDNNIQVTLEFWITKTWNNDEEDLTEDDWDYLLTKINSLDIKFEMVDTNYEDWIAVVIDVRDFNTAEQIYKEVDETIQETLRKGLLYDVYV